MLRYSLVVLAASFFALSSPLADTGNIKTLLKQKQDAGLTTAPPVLIPYSYIVEIELIGPEKDPKNTFVARYRYNPQAKPGTRMSFIGRPLADFPPKFQDKMIKADLEATAEDTAAEFWCVGGNNGALTLDEVTVIREDAHQAVVALGRDDLRSIMNFGNDLGDEDLPKKLSKRMDTELTISKPDLTLRHLKAWLPKPTSFKIFGKIKTANIDQTCARAPNGFAYVSKSVLRLDASVFGKDINQDVIVQISDLRPL